MSPPALSIVIPAFNEEHRLGPTLERICAYADEHLDSYEVIVVDDGSSDRTAEVARSTGTGAVSVLELGANQGKGAAVRAGMLAATGERVLFSDADLATPIEEVAKLSARLDAGYDIAIASRGLAGADIRVRQHPIREAMGRTFNVLVRLVVLGGIKDTQCGFKLFTRAAAHDLFDRATIDGFAFDVEVLWLAQKRYRVAEVPVVWRHIEESKVSPGTDAARMFVDLFRLRLRHFRR